MNSPTPSSRDNENPEPQELNRPVPKVLLALVALLLVWAVYYIVADAPGLESSSTPQGTQPTPAAPAPSAD
ncbi:hypothetical protein [Comamonas sp. SCN 65-56]|uniref:hypothetical protein n=1 Tax=Comamonas sp. SCN 65-56 TaxID=1660095 RepID=UPI00086CFB3F|nr:hypothetical protein [Comamonas sp. SCN 65-56]ODS90385.1 MAG: hypothetical protein ABS45_16040 [Comamonas sp. SCN 65-56]